MPQSVAARARAEPVLAVLVCHDGEPWLREVLSALRRSSPRPRHVIAVDTGSRDRTPALLAEAAEGDQSVIDGVLTLNRFTGFGAAVRAAVSAAVTRWGDPGRWIWLLHDDSAPDPDCLGVLLRTAELSASAGLLGPLALDWTDPRLVVEVGLSTDASGHRQTGVGPTELDWSRFRAEDDHQETFAEAFEQSTEALAVSSAGALIRRDVWDDVDGYDDDLPLLRDDVDFGWRVNRAGALVLCVPAARLRHARAVTRGLRPPDALRGKSVRAADRAHGLRTFLVNTTTFGFVLGLPRLVLLSLLRAMGFTLLRRLADARAELGAVGYLLSGKAKLRAARSARVDGQQVRGLLTSRTTRLRNAFGGGVTSLVRRRVAADAALGRLPSDTGRPAWVAPDAVPRPVGPAALPAGALGRRGHRVAGLRRPAQAIAVPLAEPDGRTPVPRPRPSPVPRDGSAPATPELMLVEVDRGRVAAQLLLAPPVLLFAGLVIVALLTNRHRLGTHLAGGALLPVQGLAATWSDYLATWHAVAGGTAAPAPATLAVLGALGSVLYPVGGPPTAVAVLLLGDAPLAGLLAYVATRRLPVRRWVRALVAAGYALLPPATAAVAQGRLDVVVVHILLPPVLAGVVALLTPSARGWLSTAAGSAIGLAVIGAFSPLTHATVVLVALVGFVAVPGGGGDGRRRVAALFTVVLLPLALLVPWPTVILTRPSVLLTGMAGDLPAAPVDVGQLVALDPGGPGAGWTGVLVLMALAVAIVLRPRRAVLPGAAVAVLGAIATGLVTTLPVGPLSDTGARVCWTGAPLVVVGAGLLWALLSLCRPGPVRSPVRVVAALGALAVLGLAAGAVLAAAGPLTAHGPALAEPLANELTDTGRSTLVLAGDGAPTRVAGARLPAFGDDDIARAPGAAQRMAGWDAALTSGDRDRTRTAIAQAATAGVLFLVLPDQVTADRFVLAAGDLASRVPATSDGHPVERLQPASGAVTLISPALAKQAVTGGQPPTTLGAAGISPVQAAPPDVAVHVSEGPPGRLLVLAAEDENGWQASVGGDAAPTVRAWGHLVAVTVPLDAADVRVYLPSSLRDALLVVQAAVLLFALLTAVPGRR